MFEIQSSQMAEQKGDPKLKPFANQMVADHTETTDAIKSMVQSGKVKAEIPAAMLPSDQKMIDNLKGLSGGDFTRQYASDQVTAHKNAVSLYERYSKGGDNDDLKAFTSKTLPTLQHHLDMAQNLNK